MKAEPDSESEMYLIYSDNADDLLDMKEEEDPLAITFPVMEDKIEVSCVHVLVYQC
jgi:hypothetical protein